MNGCLPNYSITPIAFPAEKEITFTVRPLGAHAAFRQGTEYQIKLQAVDRPSSHKDNPVLTVIPDEDGCLRFKAALQGEREHLVRIHSYNGEKWQRFIQLSIYSLLPDLACRLPFRGDLHVHSFRSDGRQEPAITAANYRALGYDFMAITDHNRYYPSLDAMKRFAAIPTAYTLVPGEEVHLPMTHVHIVNFGGLNSVNGLVKSKEAYVDIQGDPNGLALYGNPPASLEYEEFQEQISALAETLEVPEDVEKIPYAVCVWAFQRIREADGLGIFAHPYWLADTFHVSDAFTHHMMENHPFDAFEVLGGENYYLQNGYQTSLYYEECIKGRIHPIVGSTDSHDSTANNRNYDICSTIVFSPANERKALIESVKEKYSVAVDTISKEYRLVGPERFQRYGCFLLENWYPIHDKFCQDEGHWMKEYLTENTEGAMDVLTVLGPKVKALFDKYFVVE